MKLLKVALIFLGCTLSSVVLAQDAELANARESFKAALRKDDFSEVERLHSALTAANTRTKHGVFLADLHVDFFSLAECHHHTVRTTNDTTVVTNLDSETCRVLQEKRLTTWSKQFPNSQLPTLARSAIYLDKAKTLNAIDSANNVMREKNLNDAISILDSTPAKLREPIWYAMRMDVATAQGWGAKNFWSLVNDALSKFPNHSVVYRKATVHFLPKNGGSSEELEQLAQLAISKSMSTEGVSMYAHIYDEVIFGSGRYWQTAYSKTNVSWQVMKSGLSDIYKRFPDAWNLGRYAQHACIANDLGALKTLLDQIEKSPAVSKEAGWFRGELARCTALAARHKPTISTQPQQRVAFSERVLS